LLQIVRPPVFRRLLRPTIIRPHPPRLVANEKLLNTTEPVTSTPIEESSIDSSLSTTLSTISSNVEKGEKKKTCCYCLPCCQSKGQQSIGSTRISHRTIHNYPNLKLKTRTTYIIIIVLFIFFLIVVILLIVLIVVRH
jgi:hypothetical protein